MSFVFFLYLYCKVGKMWQECQISPSQFSRKESEKNIFHLSSEWKIFDLSFWKIYIHSFWNLILKVEGLRMSPRLEHTFIYTVIKSNFCELFFVQNTEFWTFHSKQKIFIIISFLKSWRIKKCWSVKDWSN
jgi:hypothetical protein